MKFIINWLFILTLPIWGGFALFFTVLINKHEHNDLLRGKKWFWKAL